MNILLVLCSFVRFLRDNKQVLALFYYCMFRVCPVDRQAVILKSLEHVHRLLGLYLLCQHTSSASLLFLRQTVKNLTVRYRSAPETGQAVEFVGGVNLLILQTKAETDGVGTQMRKE